MPYACWIDGTNYYVDKFVHSFKNVLAEIPLVPPLLCTDSSLMSKHGYIWV
jgi:hypothetical protein